VTTTDQVVGVNIGKGAVAATRPAGGAAGETSGGAGEASGGGEGKASVSGEDESVAADGSGDLNQSRYSGPSGREG
jgi:hypothetical protein